MEGNYIFKNSVQTLITPTTPLISVSKNGVPVTKKVTKDLSLNETRLRLWNQWTKIDNTYYYFKQINYIYTFLEELIGEQISKYFDLNTVHYEIGAKKENKTIKYGLLSKNFRLQQKTYFESIDLHLNRYHGFELFDHLEEYNEEGQYNLLISDLKKMIIRDFYTHQIDRLNGNNFFFQIDDDKLRLSPLHDYESSFEEFSLQYHNLFASFDLENPKIVEYFHQDKEFNNLFKKIYLLDMKKILENIEKIYQIKISKNHQNYFLDYDEQVKEHLLKLHI